MTLVIVVDLQAIEILMLMRGEVNSGIVRIRMS